MSNKFITIVMHGFPAEFPILFTNGEETTGTTVPYDGVPGYVSTMANTHGVKQIKIYGNSQYAAETIDNIKEFAAKEYNNNDLEIEVISK